MFHPDTSFLIEKFEDIVSVMPTDLIAESKENGSYYDFMLKTHEHIIVPREINFTFKYMHLIKEKNPAYWERLMSGWGKLVSTDFGDPLDFFNRTKSILKFEEQYFKNHYGILPPIHKMDDNFIYFKNLERVASQVHVNMGSAIKFLNLYKNPVVHWWNRDVKTYIFPASNIRFYGIIGGELVMLYPIWNSHRWSTELPKFINDTRDLTKVVKFEQFNIDEEQESIRIMNGSPSKELFR